MRIAILHNRYVHRGGEDSAVDGEALLLRKAGHEVHLFTVDNTDEIAGSSVGKIRAGVKARWNQDSARRVLDFLTHHPVDVAHVHNFFPLLTPAVHAAVQGRGIPVVQTLHNYRLLCANGMFLRAERVCEDCVTRGPWNAVRHACYRGSRLQTAVWADQTAFHRKRATWSRAVDLFTTPSRFAREKLLAAGLPPERVVVLPNAVADPGPPEHRGRGGVFVGRLSREKGLHLLLEAWRSLGDVPLAVVGTGPEEGALRAAAASLPNVRFLGQLDRAGVTAAFRAAAFAVVPSICYENFPVAVAEAMACGRAVVASHPTALAEFVEHDRTGLLFDLGDVRSLAAACRALVAEPERAIAMGREARVVYEDELTPEANLAALEAVFRRAEAVRWAALRAQ